MGQQIDLEVPATIAKAIEEERAEAQRAMGDLRRAEFRFERISQRERALCELYFTQTGSKYPESPPQVG